MAYNVTLIPGDGIGPEVVAAALAVLEAASDRFGFGLEWTEVLAGGIAIDAYGEERPLDNASTEEAWARNRRDEFLLVVSPATWTLPTP